MNTSSSNVTSVLSTADETAAAVAAAAVGDGAVIFALEGLVMGALCLLGFVGNVMCLVVLCSERRKNANTHLLSALAVFDWLLLLSLFVASVLPRFCLYTRTCIGYVSFLRNVRAAMIGLWLAGSMVQTATIWMMVAVTFDRFLAVCSPLQTRAASSSRRARRFIVGVVVFSVCFNIPRCFHFYPLTSSHVASAVSASDDSANVDQHTTHIPALTDATNISLPGTRDTNDTLIRRSDITNRRHIAINAKDATAVATVHSLHYAIIVNTSHDVINMTTPSDDGYTSATRVKSNVMLLSDNEVYHFTYYIGLSWLVLYVVPIVSLIVLNSLLVRQIRQASRRRSEISRSGSRSVKLQSESRSVTVSIIAIVTVFILCQTPDFVHTLLSYQALGVDVVAVRYLRSVTYCFLALNSSVNFLLYSLFYLRFRQQACRVFCCCIARVRHQRSDSEVYSRVSRQGSGGNSCSKRQNLRATYAEHSSGEKANGTYV